LRSSSITVFGRLDALLLLSYFLRERTGEAENPSIHNGIEHQASVGTDCVARYAVSAFLARGSPWLLLLLQDHRRRTCQHVVQDYYSEKPPRGTEFDGVSRDDAAGARERGVDEVERTGVE
jgi:hypothetical protein